jgi:hypothetical protein
MSSSETSNSQYPDNPDTVNYDYTTANYSPPTEPVSNYDSTNYSITNFPRTDYTKFNSDTTNYNPVPDSIYRPINGDLPLNKSLNIASCQSPDMLYQFPRDPQYESVQKYMCFNNNNKLLEITKESPTDPKWLANDLSYSKIHIKWQGSQCKITTPDICSRDKLSENCQATCFISPNETINIKFKDNIWRVPDLEKEAGACTMTAISEETAQNSYCECNNVLERPFLKTKAVFDKDYSGKFWCSSAKNST